MLTLSFIIVNYNVYRDVITCVESIKRYTVSSHEIFVVDNNSSEKGIDGLPEIFPDVHYIKLNENKGFGAANNAALERAKGKYLVLVNPDIIFLDNSIEIMKQYLEENDSVGVAGPVFMRPDGGLDYYYSFFPSLYSRFLQQVGLYMNSSFLRKRREEFFDKKTRQDKPFRVDWILGACMMMRRSTYERTGGFDEAFFLYEEEVDWQRRIADLELSSYVLPRASVIHNHHSSTAKVGLAFMRYNAFRSMIIYTVKNEKGFNRIANKIMHTLSITHRFLRGVISRKYRLGTVKIHMELFGDLYRLTWIGKDKLYKLRFPFSKYQNFIFNTGS